MLKERAEIVVVRRFLTYECGCGPHCAVRTAPHTTVRVVVKPKFHEFFKVYFEIPYVILGLQDYHQFPMLEIQQVQEVIVYHGH